MLLKMNYLINFIVICAFLVGILKGYKKGFLLKVPQSQEPEPGGCRGRILQIRFRHGAATQILFPVRSGA